MIQSRTITIEKYIPNIVQSRKVETSKSVTEDDEFEYRAMAIAAAKLVWLTNLLHELKALPSESGGTKAC